MRSRERHYSALFLCSLIVVIALAQLENLVDVIINDFDSYADRWDGMVTLAMLLLELLILYRRIQQRRRC